VAQNSQLVDLPSNAAVSAIAENSFPADQINRVYRGVRPQLTIFRVTVSAASKVLDISPLDQATDDHIVALARKVKFAQVSLNSQRLPWNSLFALCFLDHANVVVPCVPAAAGRTAPATRMRLLGKAKDLYLLPQPKGYQVNTAGIDFPFPKSRSDS